MIIFVVFNFFRKLGRNEYYGKNHLEKKINLCSQVKKLGKSFWQKKRKEKKYQFSQMKKKNVKKIITEKKVYLFSWIEKKQENDPGKKK